MDYAQLDQLDSIKACKPCIYYENNYGLFLINSDYHLQSMQHGLAEAKSRLGDLTHLVDAGQEVVIAELGKPGCRPVAVSAMQAQSFQDNAPANPPSNLDDMANVLAGFRAKAVRHMSPVLLRSGVRLIATEPAARVLHRHKRCCCAFNARSP